MAIDYQQLRIEGIYKQNAQGQLMQRVKLAGGLLSTQQALTVGRLGARFGSGTLHLSTRGSIEFHDLEYPDLSPVQRGLSEVGLFSRGACGGAVRGISCSTGFGTGFEKTQLLARRLLNYFSGNPHFEGLPKKFKIAVEADYQGSRHLIQDLALVYVGEDEQGALYDVWVAGGLGRQPQAAFLLAERVREKRLLAIAEGVVRIYREGIEPPKRLKHLLNEIGEEEFRRRLAEKTNGVEPLVFSDGFDKCLLPVPADAQQLKILVPVFAGELPAERLQLLAEQAASAGVGWLLVTPDQDIALLAPDPEVRQQLLASLTAVGFAGIDAAELCLRVCPGSHECQMGLAATRELAAEIQERLGDRLKSCSLAISGCPNSCAQPQLADIGIIASKSIKLAEGGREPRFDLYRRTGEGLGELQAKQLSRDELWQALAAV